MFTRIKPGLTYANVMATIAVFLALGGGAYAATQLPKNSVGPRQIKKNAVSASKIKSKAVNSSKVKDHSLLSQDFKTGQLPTGAQGIPGAKGDTGAAAFKAYARIAVDASSATVLASSGGVSVSRVVTGDTDVTFPAPFNAATCAVTATIDSSGATTGYIRKSSVGSGGSTVRIIINDTAGAYADIPYDIAVFC